MQKIKLKGKESVELAEDTVLSIEDNASVTIMVIPQKDMKLEVKVGKNCTVDSFVIAEKNARLEQVNHIDEKSVMNTFSLWLSEGGGNLLNSLEGPGSQAYDVQVFVENGEKKLHLNSVLRHASSDTKGNILIKGVVRDQAHAKLDGMIRIEKNGGGAESFLSEHVILLNPGAHASANPELEIENNDVSSRHAASVSQIDQEKIFYLCSRGLSMEESKKLIIEGFLEAAVAKVGNVDIRKRIIEKTIASL